jgi:5-methylcytosine-specific restriction endonuclease McrA
VNRLPGVEKRDKMAAFHPWYNRAIWRGPRGLRLMVINRDPICMLCQRAYSTVADHIRPFRSGATQQEQWDLFTSLSNLRGICSTCHNKLGEKSFATGDGQRQSGHRSHIPGIVVRTAEGIPFVTSSLTQAQLDKGLEPETIKALLGL